MKNIFLKRVFPILCTLAVLLCCVPALAVTAAADGVILPVLPDGEFSYWYITQWSSGVYVAYNSDEFLVDKGSSYEVKTASRYELIADAWVFQEYYDGGNGMTTLLYDSTGTYATKSLAIFGLPDPTEPPPPPSLDGPGSVLPVFSGIFTWLGGSILEASTLFWTADGGLSVLGTLAVISLGLALIILILYLISGFLKFR